MTTDLTKIDPQQLDLKDPLASYRDRFNIPKAEDGTEVTYLCGNSLGLQPKNVTTYVQQELDDWAKLGVEGHLHARTPWLSYHEALTEGLMHLTGADSNEVVAMNSLTVNLHLMLVSFYRPTKDRFKILMGYSPFPSDRYAIESQLKFHGYDPKEALVMLEPASDQPLVTDKLLSETIAKHSDSLALVLLEGVNYYTGQAINFTSAVQQGHAAGAIVGLDLAHTIGNIPLDLHNWGVDFAVWCSYKYLNGGPGCIAGCFVHQKHGDNREIPRFAGWWGNNKAERFKMGPNFDPIPGVEGWQLSNPPILPLAALKASLELFQEATVPALREKSIQLTGYLDNLLRMKVPGKVKIITPADPTLRGCQLSLRVAGGKETFNQLIKNNIICDWREPDVIRIAPTPLYNSYHDVYRFVEVLAEL